MAKEIQAAVIDKFNDDFEIRHILVDDDLEANEVLVHIVSSGICRSDETQRTGLMVQMLLPVVLGHEGAGIVEKVGSAVKNIQVGDHVVLSYNYDGTCDHCLSGAPASCEHFSELNFTGLRPNGKPSFTAPSGQAIGNVGQESTFSTTTIVQERNVTVIDKSVDLRLVGPLGCGFATGSSTVFNALEPKPGSTIAIFGSGAVGAGALMAAKIAGCTTIIAVDIHENRLSTSIELGATDTVNSATVNPVEAIKDLTDGHGVDFAIDTTGVSAVMKQAFDSLGINGVFAPLATGPAKFEFVPNAELDFPQKRIYGVLMGNTIPQIEIKRLINFWKKGLYPFDKLEKLYKFSEINEANAASKSGEVIKPIVIMDESYSV